MAEDALPVTWIGDQAVVTLPQHVDVSNADRIREQLLWVINRGAAVLIADLTRTVSCDYSGADALARAQHRAVANGTELRLIISADVVRRVLTLNGFDRLVPVYPDLDGTFAAGAEHREQGARTAGPVAQAEELLNVAVVGISSAGLILQAAVDLPPDVTGQRINEALRSLGDIVREIRTHLLTDRGPGNGPDAAWRLPPHILERSTQARHRSELLQEHVARTARAVQSAAADTAALMEQRADLLRHPGRIDYPTDIKRWRVLADQARQIAERWEQP